MSPNQPGVNKRAITPDHSSQSGTKLGTRAKSPNQPGDDLGMDGLGPPSIPPAPGPTLPNSQDVITLVPTNACPIDDNPRIDGLGTPSILPALDPALPNPQDVTTLVSTDDNPSGDLSLAGTPPPPAGA